MIDAALTHLLQAAMIAHDPDDQNAGDRVTPSTSVVNLASERLPRVAYTRTGGERDYTDDGAGGIATTRYQLDIFADTLALAIAVAAQVRGTLDGYSGTAADVGVVRIHFPESERFETTPVTGGANRAIVRISQDVTIQHR